MEAGAVGEALAGGDHAQNLLLAVGEHRAVVRGPHADLGDEPGRELGRNDRLASGAGEHRVHDLLAPRLLRQKETPGQRSLR